MIKGPDHSMLFPTTLKYKTTFPAVFKLDDQN